MHPWTYSALDKFETCPRQYYHLRVKKDVFDPPTVHREWGETVHRALEQKVKTDAPLPPGMGQWDKIMATIASLPGEKKTEHRLAASNTYRPVEWGQSWVRGIIDLLIINDTNAAVLDYKTGKRKPSEQLDLYAALVFSHYPNVERVSTGYVWLQEKNITKKKITREESGDLWRSFTERATRLASAFERDSWPARPSGLCRGWCPVKTCEHWKAKR